MKPLTFVIALLWALTSPLAAFAGVWFDLGRPTVGDWQRKAWVIWDPVLKKELLWSQESSQEGAAFYALDLETGNVVEEYDIPAREVGGVLPAQDGTLFVYTYSGLTYPGNELLRFDPRKRRVERLGLANTPRNRCVDGVIGADGNVYIGTHQQGRLFRFDVKNESWNDLGQMVPQERRSRSNIWLRNLHVLPSGKLLGAVVTSPPPIVVEIDPGNGGFRVIDALKSDQFKLYKDWILVPHADGFSAHDLEYRKRHDLASKTFGQQDANFALIDADSNWGVLVRVGDTLYRIAAFDDEPQRAKSPLPLFGDICLASQQRVVVVYHPARQFAIIDMKTGESRIRPIGYAGKRGTQICGLNKMGDGSIYGTNIIGMHLFRYDPKLDTTRNLGHVGWPGGEVYNVIDVAGKIYFGTYGGGYWGVYDPEQPWRPDFRTKGTADDANPRNLGQLGGDDPNAVNRPFEYVLGPGGKIYIACQANYGYSGGALVEFDPQSAAKRLFRDQKRSVQTVTSDGRYVYGGTNMYGGRGAEELASDGTLFIFDPATGKRIFEETIVPDAKAVVCLRYNPKDKRLYAATDNQMLVAFDPLERKVLRSWKIRSAGTPLAGVPEEVGMIHITPAADGNVYGVTQRDLFRLDTGKGIVEYLDAPPIPDLYQIVEGEPGCSTQALEHTC